MMKFLMAVLVAGALAGCAPGQPESQAQQSDDAACTAQADAVYNANNQDQLARTSQNGLLFPATPSHVFDAEQQGGMHERDSQITHCEQNGNADGQPSVNGVPVVTPHIVGTN
jgi:hypothetical protein